MTNEEFSNQLDTLLNSYNTQAGFGEGSNKQGGIALDEYEKSVLLTQAQDIIVKSYFDKTLNQQGQGFDDSPRRQVDFSSLIKVYHYTRDTDKGVLVHDDNSCYDDRGLKVKLVLDDNSSAKILFILNERLEVTTGSGKKIYVVVPINYREYDREMSKAYAQPLKKQAWRLFSNAATGYDIQSEIIPIYGSTQEEEFHIHYMVLKSQLNNTWLSTETKPKGGIMLGIVSSDNEIPDVSKEQKMYAADSYYEVEEKAIVDLPITYTIRYVQRPAPIVLRTLPDGLSIDGVSKETPCSLNPILHTDILNKAFELAVSTRGGGTAQRQQNNDNQRQ